MIDKEIIAVFHYDDKGSKCCGSEPYRYAEEIIRCKECKHNPKGIGRVSCPMTGANTRKPDDFCSYGEPNSSEKPNNYCDDCLYTDTCDSKEFFYACTSKATISKMEQVDKDINVRSKEPQGRSE